MTYPTAYPIIAWTLALAGFAGTLWPYFAPSVRPDRYSGGRPTSLTIAIVSAIALATAGVLNLILGGGVPISAFLIGGAVAHTIMSSYQVRDYRRRVEMVAEASRLPDTPAS